MTESDWLKSNNTLAMLAHVERAASERKLRLFICSACRRLWHLLKREPLRNAVELAERYVDDLVSHDAMIAAGELARLTQSDGWQNAASLAIAAAGTKLTDGSRQVASTVADPDMIREIFGNPFQPLHVEESWLRWNDGTLVSVARGIYEEHCFDELPILADALEDAGCRDEEMLNHCRAYGMHFRGCWLLDAILGKE